MTFATFSYFSAFSVAIFKRVLSKTITYSSTNLYCSGVKLNTITQRLINILANRLYVCLKDSGERYDIYMFKEGLFLLEYLSTNSFLRNCKEIYVFDSRFKRLCWSRVLLYQVESFMTN